MTAKAIQVSLDDELVARLDQDPEVKTRGRSAFIRSAIELYLRARRRAAADEQIAEAYAGEADGMLDEIEDLLGGQSWPVE